MTPLYIKLKNGRYVEVNAPLVQAEVKFTGNPILDGFTVSLTGQLDGVQPDLISSVVTKGVLDMAGFTKKAADEIAARDAEIAKLRKEASHAQA